MIKKIVKKIGRVLIKKPIRKIVRVVARPILLIIFKLRLYSLLPLTLKLFPQQSYWVINKLLFIGYLDIATNLINSHSMQSENEKLIKDRVDSMNSIIDNGLMIGKEPKNAIKDIKVLFAIHNSLPYDSAGYAVRTDMIATNIQAKGIDIVCATRAGYPWDLQKHRGRDKNYKDIVNGVVYRRLLDEDKTFKKGSDFRYIDNYANRLVEVAIENKSTIIHGHSNYLNALSAIRAANILKIPSIYEIRGLWHLTRLTLDAQYRERGMFEYEMEMVKGGAKGADAVVTISTALKELLLSWGIEEKKIFVIPNAVDTKYFKVQEPSRRLIEKYDLEKKVVVGYIGSLTGYEGLEELVLAVNGLVVDGLEIVLMVVGDGRERSKLEKLIKSKNIIFTGRVPFAEVEEYYSIFDICPFPRNNYEVCRYVPPLKILEAMAMKKAMIVSDVAPLVEIVEDGVNGLVCKSDSVESLREVIARLYSDKKEREELSQRAYEWVLENRTWDRMSQKYMELYSSFKG